MQGNSWKKDVDIFAQNHLNAQMLLLAYYMLLLLLVGSVVDDENLIKENSFSGHMIAPVKKRKLQQN